MIEETLDPTPGFNVPMADFIEEVLPVTIMPFDLESAL